MKISWEIQKSDIDKVQKFIRINDNIFVQSRRKRNIERIGVVIDEDILIKTMLMCLLTSQQRSGPNTPVGKYLAKNPFPITRESISKTKNIEEFLRENLNQNNLNRFLNKIPKSFSINYKSMRRNNWELMRLLEENFNGKQTKQIEREIADYLNSLFVGFGPKQSRNFLQALGLTKYEIPIDSRITKWLNDFGFPVSLSSTSLQDKGYYHFVSDGIQKLCDQAEIYPCILDAAIFASFDNNEWTEENMVF